MLKAMPSLAAAVFLGLPVAPALAQSCEDRIDDFARRAEICAAEAAAAVDPDAAATALGYQGEALRMMGQLEAAKEALDAALQLAPKNAWYWVELGHVRFDAGDPAGAVAHYTQALELAPGDAYALTNRADGWWDIGAPDRCMADIDAALAVTPDDTFARNVRGFCLTSTGRPEEALADFDRVIAADAGWMLPYLGKAEALLLLDRAAEAISVAEAGLAAGNPVDPDFEQDLLALRLDAATRGMALEGALAEAEALAARYPDNLMPDRVRVRALLAAGNPAQAEAAATRLRDAAGTPAMKGAFHDTLAQLDLAQGRVEAAALNLGRAMALDPGLTRAYAKQLSELGYLPLSRAPADLVAALRRCITEKGADCRVGG